MQAGMKILFCIVSYRSDTLLERYLVSIESAHRGSSKDISLRLLLIDNSERDGSDVDAFRQRMSACAPQAEIVLPERNLGYFGAIPIAQAACEEFKPDVVVFSNADLELDGDFFSQLLARLPHHAAVIAPAMLLKSQPAFDQNPWFPSRYSAAHLRFLRFVCSYAPLFALYSRLGLAKERFRMRRATRLGAGQPAPMPREIYAPYGAMFIFTRPGFFLGLPRFGAFLYCEELFVAEEARRRNESIHYVPSIRVFDSPHASTGKLTLDRNRRLLLESLDFILGHYYPA
jgi:GT2 family glycosyltransferase